MSFSEPLTNQVTSAMGFKEQPWTKPNAGRVKLLGPVCVSYGHPDLDKIDDYLYNFGMVRDDSFKAPEGGICYRGYGVQPVVYIARHTPEPKFFGVYFEAASEEDLQKATKIPGAGPITDFIANGKVVDIVDPTGTLFHVVFGYDKRAYTPPETDLLAFNYAAASDGDTQAKPRRGDFQRLRKGATPVHKLGHCGYVAGDFQENVQFYSTHFNFVPSDIMSDNDDNPFMCFFHVDLGKEYSEHHSFFLAQPFSTFKQKPGDPHHAAFEVENIDKVFVGHDNLLQNGYKPFWGVGRHIEGSQVFDYWYDLDGFVVEHYSDGDLVNEDSPIGLIKGRPMDQGSNWGPPPIGHMS